MLDDVVIYKNGKPLFLPKLPKIIKKKEANFGLKLRAWIEANPRPTCSIETKDTRGKNYFPFKELDDRQIQYAVAINESKKGVLIRVQGVNGEPDYVYLRQEPAYIVIKYPRFFCLIPIGNILHERDTRKQKSLTAERAKEIAVLVV